MLSAKWFLRSQLWLRLRLQASQQSYQTVPEPKSHMVRPAAQPSIRDQSLPVTLHKPHKRHTFILIPAQPPPLPSVPNKTLPAEKSVKQDMPRILTLSPKLSDSEAGSSGHGTPLEEEL